MKKRGIVALWVLSGILLAAAGLYFFPYTSHLELEVRGMEIRSGEEQTRTVRIQGTYSDYLFKNDRFEGNICIEGYEPSEEAAAKGGGVIGFEVVPEGNYLTYIFFSEPGQPRLVSGGMICAEPYFEKFTIFCTMDPAALDGDPETSYESSSDYYSLTDHILSYPAQNAQEAEEQADFYLEKMQTCGGMLSLLGTEEES
jgi:hypothetical protein